MGELHLVMGPMFSSKTSEIIRLVEKYTALDIPTFVVNHSLDTRFHSDGCDPKKKCGIFTHDGKWCEGIQTSYLHEVFTIPAYKAAKVVCIDEANFFVNLRQYVQYMVERDHKVVYVAGLSGTFDRQEFGQLSQLIPIADSIKMLQSICVDCQDGKTPAIFTKLRIQNKEPNDTDHPVQLKSADIQIGGKEKYKPVCRQHFIEQ